MSVRKERGIAFLWVLVAAALIPLSFVEAGRLNKEMDHRSKERMLFFAGEEIRQGIKSYYESTLRNGQSEYPASLQDLLSDGRQGKPVRHLRRIYADPFTGNLNWGLIKRNGRVIGVYPLSNIRLKRVVDAGELGISNISTTSELWFVYMHNDATLAAMVRAAHQKRARTHDGPELIDLDDFH